MFMPHGCCASVGSGQRRVRACVHVELRPAMAWRRWTKRCVRWPVMMVCGNPLSKTRSVTFNQRCLVSAAASTNTCTLRGAGIVGEYRIGLG